MEKKQISTAVAVLKNLGPHFSNSHGGCCEWGWREGLEGLWVVGCRSWNRPPTPNQLYSRRSSNSRQLPGLCHQAPPMEGSITRVRFQEESIALSHSGEQSNSPSNPYLAAVLHGWTWVPHSLPGYGHLARQRQLTETKPLSTLATDAAIEDMDMNEDSDPATLDNKTDDHLTIDEYVCIFCNVSSACVLFKYP